MSTDPQKKRVNGAAPDEPSPIPERPPAPDYREIAPHLLLAIGKQDAVVVAARANVRAEEAAMQNLLVSVADEMGYRASQVRFENVPNPDGTVSFKLVVI